MLTVLALLLSTAAAQTLQDELAELDKKIEAKKIEIQIAELQLQLSDINGDEQQQITAQMNLMELEAQMTELTAKNNTWAIEITELHACIRSLESDLVTAMAALETAQASNSELKKENADLNSRLSTYSASMEAAQAVLECLQQSYATGQ